MLRILYESNFIWDDIKHVIKDGE